MHRAARAAEPAGGRRGAAQHKDGKKERHMPWVSRVAGALALCLALPAAAQDEDGRMKDFGPAEQWPPPGQSYMIPLAEIIAYELLLNQAERNFAAQDRGDYASTPSTISHNLRHGWVLDNDPFATNQFQHPYGGSLYFNFARSAGLDYWTSMAYAFGGSLLWEYAGERTTPSINDQVTTSLGGPFLGEPLFRMASLVLEQGGPHPGFWREWAAALLSPSTGFNRLAFGDRFSSVFPSHDPAYFSRLSLGATMNADVHSNINLNANLTPDEPSAQQTLKRTQPAADFAFSYGLPGKPGYTYNRPFDYFNFEFGAVPANIFENIMIRGLLYGAPAESGDDYRGIWGLYGSYDYIAPQIYRVSTSALSFGTTAEWWPMRRLTLQYTVLGGLGYGAAGTIHGSGERNYHYGLTPQGLLAARLTYANRVQFDMTTREYYVSGVGSTEHRGAEDILRAEGTLTFRLFGRHGLAVKYVDGVRDAHYPDLAQTHQSVRAISVFYTLLGDTEFGTVDWRQAEAGQGPPQPHSGDHLLDVPRGSGTE
jgi:hypothetical protein